jgi:hypothetical protein
MSQTSDIYSSSVIEGVGIDKLQYLIPDDTLFTSPFPSSQLTLDTIHDPSSISSQTVPLAPESLKRIKLNRVNEFLLYEDKMSKDFIAWWLQTDYGRTKHINWDAKHQVNCWEGF